MGKAIGTLSTKGFIEDAYYKADRILSYFFLSDAYQSNIYFGKIASLPNDVKVSGADPLLLQKNISNGLTQMFTSSTSANGEPLGYFDAAVVNVKVSRTEDKEGVNEDIEINVILTENGKQYSLGKLVSVVNSKIKEIIDINNG